MVERMKRLIRLLNLSETAATMCAAIGGLFLLLLVVGLTVTLLIFPFERPIPYAMGLLVGCALSAVKVVILESALNKSADMAGGQARGYVGIMAITRYALTVIVMLLAAFFRDIFGLFGAIMGILTMQLSAYIASAILNKREKT
jgi:hypothetical protein